MLTGNVHYDYLEFPENYTVAQVLHTFRNLFTLIMNEGILSWRT